MKKIVFLAPIIAVLLLVTTVIAKDKPEGNPFQAIWEAIDNLQEQIDNIQPGATELDCVTNVKMEQPATSVWVTCPSDDYIVTGGGCRIIGEGNLQVSRIQSYTYIPGWWCEMDTSGVLEATVICCRLA